MSDLLIGKIVSISDLNIEVALMKEQVKYRDILYVEENGKKHQMEVSEVSGSIAMCLPLESEIGRAHV